MLDELEGPGGRASREFRQKFPDEIVTDNLGGQVTSLILQFCLKQRKLSPLSALVWSWMSCGRLQHYEQGTRLHSLHQFFLCFDALFILCLFMTKFTRTTNMDQLSLPGRNVTKSLILRKCSHLPQMSQKASKSHKSWKSIIFKINPILKFIKKTRSLSLSKCVHLPRLSQKPWKEFAATWESRYWILDTLDNVYWILVPDTGYWNTWILDTGCW